MSLRESNVLIFGASVRAAAFSALRAGLTPWCADLFADADLRRRCRATRLAGPYPHAFLDLVGDDRPGAWVYTGGLENHPLLVALMADRRRLWGTPAAALLRARAPDTLAAASADAGLAAPAFALSGCVPAERSWLLKPRAGVGGIGIRLGGAGEPIPPGHFAQEFVPGTPTAALFVAVGGRSVYLGLTRQLVGEQWLSALPFRYCGSVGPLAEPAGLPKKLRRLGAALARRAGLVGLFGVDGLLAGEAFSPVEVNPRYTASVEIIEWATGVRAFALHRRAFDPAPGPPLPPGKPAAGPVVGKAVVFARADGTFPAAGPWVESLRLRSADALPDFADIPVAGTPLRRGMPVLTVFAAAANEADCEARLRRRATELDRLLYPDRSPAPGEPP